VSSFDGVLRYPVGYQVFGDGESGFPATRYAAENFLDVFDGIDGFIPQYQG